MKPTMKKSLFALTAASLAAAGCMHDRATADDRGEARLAAMLAGRVAGEPRSCIPAYGASRLQIVDRTAVVYDAGGTIWVSRPSDPRSLDTRDVMLVQRTGSQLCKQDVVRMVDRTGGFMTGVIFLDDFVPYTRP